MSEIAVIAVHPDDETIGCGGTLLKHKRAGDNLYWIIMTKMHDRRIWSEQAAQKRKHEIEEVSDRYGFSKIFQLDLPAAELDQIPMAKIIREVAGIFSEIKPDSIYLVNRSDVHSDHKITAGAVISAAKTFHLPSLRRLLMYETISETDFAMPLPENAFQPNFFVDISAYLEQKLEIANIYESEIKSHPFPRNEKNLRALATFRGAQCGVNFAEAFMILKEIWK